MKWPHSPPWSLQQANTRRGFKEQLPEASGKNSKIPAPSSPYHIQTSPKGQGKKGQSQTHQ